MISKHQFFFKEVHLADILAVNLESAESCVQAFREASEIGCELCHHNGESVASSGYSCSACDVCAGTGISREDCKKLHAFTAKVSRSGDGKYLYECPLGLSYITAAVSGGQGKLLRLTAGPFLMEDKQDFEEFDLPKLKDLSASDIRNVMSRIDPVPVADPKKVNAFSQLLVYSAAFLSGVDRGGEAYLAELEDTEAWERANRIDPAQTVKLVNDYIGSNFGRDISLLDIARHAGMTTSYLCRLYKRECGTTVNAYLTQVRIERSKGLLAEGVPIAEAARRCGFSDQSYFTKVFRQTEGITPLKYKKTI